MRKLYNVWVNKTQFWWRQWKQELVSILRGISWLIILVLLINQNKQRWSWVWGGDTPVNGISLTRTAFQWEIYWSGMLLRNFSLGARRLFITPFTAIPRCTRTPSNGRGCFYRKTWTLPYPPSHDSGYRNDNAVWWRPVHGASGFCDCMWLWLHNWSVLKPRLNVTMYMYTLNSFKTT